MLTLVQKDRKACFSGKVFLDPVRDGSTLYGDGEIVATIQGDNNPASSYQSC